MAITLGNFSSINDRTVLTGLSGSGLDTEGLINGLVAAREIPKTNLEDRVTLNNNKVDAYGELRAILANLKDAANFLRNPPGVQNEADNVFKYRSATLTSNTSIAASNYLSVSVEPGASIQNYNISAITSLARASKQKTSTISIANADTAAVTAVATAGFFKAGTLTINGTNVTLADGDTLNQVVSKFNEVKTSTGLEASIIQVGTGQFAVSFTATALGTAAAIDLNANPDTDQVLDNLTITNTQTATDAVFTIDGVAVTRTTNSITDVVDDVTFNLLQATPGGTTIDMDVAADLSLPASGATNFISVFNDLRIFVAEQTLATDDGVFAEEAYLAAEGLLRNITSNISAELSGSINTVATTATELITNGTFDSDITGWTDASLGTGAVAHNGSGAMQLTGGGSGGNEAFAQQSITTEVGKQYTVKATFASLTNSAYIRVGSSASVGSSSNFDISNTEVTADGVATFTFTATGTTTYLTFNSDTNTTAFTVDDVSVKQLEATSLSEVGITFTDLPESDNNPFTRNILNIDEEKFNSALSSNFESVENLFGFSFTSTNSNVAVFESSNNTTATSLALDIDPATSKFQATVDSVVYNFTATAVGTTGYTLKGQSGTPLEGLTLVYASTSAGTGTVEISQGIADRIYNELDSVLDEQTGQLELEINAIEDTNTRLETEIDRIEDQIERYREQLLIRFSALESLLSSVNTLLDSLEAQQLAIFGN